MVGNIEGKEGMGFGINGLVGWTGGEWIGTGIRI